MRGFNVFFLSFNFFRIREGHKEKRGKERLGVKERGRKKKEEIREGREGVEKEGEGRGEDLEI